MCAVVATIIVTFIIQRKLPDQNLVITAAIVVTGAVITGYNSFNENAYGYLLICGNNFA
jgi:intracellular septation protein A